MLGTEAVISEEKIVRALTSLTLNAGHHAPHRHPGFSTSGARRGHTAV